MTSVLSGSRAARLVPRGASDPVATEARLSAYWHDQEASGLRRSRYALRNAPAAVRAAADLLSLRRTVVELSTDPTGELVRRVLTRPTLRSRVGSPGACVLAVPAVPDDYRAGPRRQTLRRKLRSAERLGVTVRSVPDEDERRALVLLLHEALARKSDPRYRYTDTDHSFLVDLDPWHVAEDAQGRPLAVAVTPYDGRWAVLLCLISLGEGPEHSDARYLLTDAVVRALSVAGVRHLVDTSSPADLPNGLRHFQRMLGFRIERLALRRARPTGTGQATAVAREGACAQVGGRVGL